MIERIPVDAGAAVIDLRKVCMAFPKPSGGLLPVLTDVDMTLKQGEILGLLGRSGSGKSTLLRIVSGLMAPTSGSVSYCGSPLTGPAEGIAVVFQSFALFPWLTVLENVEASLNALGLPAPDVRRRASSAIALIGLNGFEAAYPRELSGGMRQRVGFARALVINPAVLLMDEPFSALDVLTAETLRTDFMDLWLAHQIPIQSVLLVTHNIEEAVSTCDRILILSSRPGCIAAEIKVGLQHPRNRFEPTFHEIVDEIYSVLTSRTAESLEAQKKLHGGRMQPLPQVSVYAIGGLIDALSSPAFEGKAELAKIARPLAMHIDHLFPVAEALHILEFGELEEGAISLTAAGRAFSQSSPEERQRLFKEHLLRFVPLVTHIQQVLDERTGHRAPRVRFESELEDHLTRRDAERTLRAVTGWARYAELFTYDDKTRTFSSAAT